MKYTIKRGNTELVTITPEGWQTKQAMGVNMVEMNFTLLEPVEFEKGDYCIVYGEKYIVINSVPFRKLSNHRYEYSMKLVHEFYTLQDVIFKGVDYGGKLTQLKFTMMGTANHHMALLIANANRVQTGWTLGFVDATESKNISYDGENLLQVLNRLASEFDTEYWIENKTIHLTKRTGSSGLTLSYGKDKGLLNLTKTNKDDAATIFTRLYVEGGDKNLPVGYRNGAKYLQLPEGTPYIEYPLKVSKYGVIEGYVSFDEVYPRRLGTVTALGGDIYTFSDSGINFDVNDHLLPATSAKITFIDGLLAGYTFEVISFNYATKTFVINEIEEPAIEGGVLPNNGIKSSLGDHYILHDIQMPASYVVAAEKELLERGKEYYELGSDIEFNDKYQADCDPLYFKRNNIDLSDKLGKTIYIIDTSPKINVSKRLATIRRNLQNPWKYELDLTDKIELSALARSYAYSKRVKLFIAGASGLLGGGSTSNNTFLASLSGNNGYLYIDGKKSKAGFADQAQDAAHAVNAELANIANTARRVESASFASGPFGHGHRLDVNGKGKSVLELDSLFVRDRLTVNELAIMRLKSIGGTFVVSNSVKITTVSGSNGAYTLGIDTDGGTIGVPFTVGAAVFVRNYNGSNQKFYAARVTGVSAASFDIKILSGTDTPEVGDELVQLDHYTDTNKKGIVLLSAADSGAPYIDVHYGYVTNPTDSLKVRLGRLDGITDPDLGTLSGFGFYGQNVYIKGTLVATGGNVVTENVFNNEIAQIDAQFDAIGNDNVATPQEKRMIIKPTYDSYASEVEHIKAQAASLGVDSTAFNNAFYVELKPYVEPILTNLNTASPADGAPYNGATLRSKFVGYVTQRSLLLKAVAQKQQEIAQDANDKIDGLQIANENLLRDSSFERLRLPDIVLLSTPGGSTPFTTNTRSSTAAVDGSSSAKIQIDIFSSSNRWAFANPVGISNNFLNHAPYGTIDKLKGKTVTYSVSIMALGNAANKPMNICYAQTGSNSSASTSVRIPITLGPANVWRRYNVSFDVASNTTFLNIFFEFKDTDGWQVGDAILMDCDFLGIGNKAPEGWLPSPFDVFDTTAKIITLSASTQIIKIDKDGNKTPANPFTVTGVAQNTNITSWQYSVDGGAYTNTTPTGVSRSGDTVTVNPNTVTFKTLSIRASDGTNSDTCTIAVVSDGQAPYLECWGTSFGASPLKGGVWKNGEVITTTGTKGHRVVVLDKDFNLVSQEGFDTYLGGTNITNLINYVEGLTDKIVCIYSYDAIAETVLLRDLFVNLGGKPGKPVQYYRQPYAIIGMSKDADGNWPLKPGEAAESYSLTNSTSVNVIAYRGGKGIIGGGAVGRDGQDGVDGQDGYTVILENEAHTFAGNTNSAIAGSTTVKVISYKGANPITPTSITVGTMPTGMTASVAGDVITFNVTSSMTSPSGTVPINIVIDGKTFSRQFSYAISFKGNDGVSIVTVDIEFAKNTNPSTPPASGWTTTAPTLGNGEQLWTRTKTSYSSGSPTYSTPVNITPREGAAGKGITSVVEEYYLSTSKTTQTGGSWVTTPPNWEFGKYIWTRVKITYTDGTTSYTTPIVSSEWEAINHLKVGSENLLDNSESVRGTGRFYDLGVRSIFEPYVGKDVSISFDLKVSIPANIKVYPYQESGISIDIPPSQVFIAAATTEWQRFVFTAKIKDWTQKPGLSTGSIAFYDAINSSNVINIRKIRISLSSIPVFDWTPSLADTEAKISAAQTAADNAQAAANNANALLADMSLDSKLTPVEKKQVKVEWDAIVSEKPKNEAQANAFSVSKTDYQNAYNNLSSYITPLLSNLSTTSDINAATFRNTFKAYYDARTDLLNAIAAKAKQLADAAQQAADNALNIANSKVTTYTSAPSSYKAGEFMRLFSNYTTGGKTFYAGKIYVANTNNTGGFNASHWDDALEVGGVNLVLDSDVPIPSTTNTLLDKYDLVKALESGKTYTVTIKGSGTSFTIRDDNGVNTLGTTQSLGGGLYRLTFGYGGSWNGNTKVFSVYNTAGGSASITWIKLEEGSSVSNEWSPAPQEMEYLKNALQKSTITSGGLTLGTVVAVRDNSSVVRAYMNGEDTNPVAFAAGVDNFAGIGGAETQKIALYKDGSGHLASGNISWDTIGNLTVKGRIEAKEGYFKNGAIEGVSINNADIKNATITSSFIGGFQVSSNTLTNPDFKARILFESAGASSDFIRLNEAPNSPLIAVRTDSASRKGVEIQTYASGATGLYIVSNDITNSSYAIRSAGGHMFYQRSGETWNAPGILAAFWIQINGPSASLSNMWKITPLTISLYSWNPLTQICRINHNLDHTEYVVHINTNNAGGWTKTLNLQQTYFEFDMDNMNNNNTTLQVLIIGRNKYPY